MPSPAAAGHGAHAPLRTQLLRECQVMAEFALSRGRQVPSWAVQAIEAFSAPDAAMGPPEVKRLAVAHEALARAVNPATPQALVMLDDESGSSFSFLGPVPFVRRMALAAMVTVVAFVVLTLRPEINDPANGDIMSADGMPLLINELFFMAAAGMGASFHALFQANRYIVLRNFDPRHEVSYWIRFLLGVIAGLMMVTLVPLNASSGHGFARPTIAMLGGFSAAAVYRILARLVETLESLVQGDSKSILETRERSARLNAEQELTRQRMKMAADLVGLQQQLASGAAGEQLRAQLARIVSSVMAADPHAEDPAEPPQRTIAVGNLPMVGGDADASADAGTDRPDAAPAATPAASMASTASSATAPASDDGP
jgi:hypothetical protein